MKPFYTLQRPMARVNFNKKYIVFFIALFLGPQVFAQLPGNALNFTGNERVVIPAGSVSVSGTYTVEAWVMPGDATATMNIFSTRPAGGDQTFDMKLQGGNTIHGDIGDGSSWITTSADASFNYTTGKWYHIAYTVSTTDFNIYVNGELISSVAIAGTPLLFDNVHNEINIGATGASENFIGNIDEVRVWNTERTATEINNDMLNAVSNLSDPALVAYYNFDEGVPGADNTAVTTLNDQSPNNLAGTLAGFTLTGTSSNWVQSYAMVVPVAKGAGGITATGFTAKWNAPANGTVNSYIVEVSAISDFSTILQTLTPTATTQAITGLDPSTQYWYRVSAVNNSITGTGAYSEPISVTTNALPSASISNDTTVCQNDAFPYRVTFTGQGGNRPYTFTYKVNGGSDQTITTTGNRRFAKVNVVGSGVFVYTLESITDSAGNIVAVNLTATINVTPSSTHGDTVAICTSQVPYTWHGFDYSATGTYTYDTVNVAGCDSLMTLVLSVTGTSNTLVTVNQADLPYSWNGRNYYHGGAYRQYLGPISAGCDSVATLRLTVNIPAPPPGFSYTSPNIFVKDTAINPLNPAAALPGSTKILHTWSSLVVASTADAAGNVYTCDILTGIVSKITPSGKVIKLASGFIAPIGVAVDATGNVYVGDAGDGLVSEILVGGSVVPLAGGFSAPYTLAVDAGGNVYVPEPADSTVKKIAPGGVVTSYWHNNNQPVSVAMDTANNLFVGDYGGFITELSPESGTIPVGFIKNGLPSALAVDGSDNVFIKDVNNEVIDKMGPSGIVTVIYTGSAIQFGLGVDSLDNVYTPDAVDQLTQIKKIAGPAGAVGAYAVKPALPAGLTLNTSTGIISGTPNAVSAQKTYTVTASNARGSVTTPVVISVTNKPGDLFSYSTPNVFVKNKTITALTPVLIPAALKAGAITVVANGFNVPVGVAVDAAGNIYVADADNNVVKKISADGTSIAVIGSGFNLPTGVAVDAAGNVYVADFGNSAVKKIAPDSVTVTTLGNGFAFGQPQGIAVDASGNVYVADPGNGAVEEIAASDGNVSVIGSGIISPTGVDVDATGNVFVADGGSNAIKVIAAGGGGATVTIPITHLNGAGDVKVDASGNIYVTAVYNRSVRKITFPGGTPTVTTISSAFFNGLGGLAVDRYGTVYVSDALNDLVLKIAGNGQAVNQFTINPPLPDGLVINPTNGIISGRPTTSLANTPFTVTAQRTGGDLTFSMNIQINVSDTAAVTVCSSNLPYHWNGTNYSTAGVYPSFQGSAGGFDSTITLKLSISNITADAQPAHGVSTVCYGSSLSVRVNAAGGTVPYGYRLTGNPGYQPNKTFLLPAGTYTFDVQDDSGCTVTSSPLIINGPASELNFTFSRKNVSCVGNDGSIAVIPSGGFGNYMYRINGGSYGTDSIFSSLSDGTYKVSLTDASSCITDKNIAISLPNHPCSSFSSSTGPTSATAQMSNELKVRVYPNPGAVEFNMEIVSGDSKNIVELRVMDMLGKTIYQTRGSVFDMYRFGRTFAGGMYIAEVMNGKNVQRIKLVKGN